MRADPRGDSDRASRGDSRGDSPSSDSSIAGTDSSRRSSWKSDRVPESVDREIRDAGSIFGARSEDARSEYIARKSAKEMSREDSRDRQQAAFRKHLEGGAKDGSIEIDSSAYVSGRHVSDRNGDRDRDGRGGDWDRDGRGGDWDRDGRGGRDRDDYRYSDNHRRHRIDIDVHHSHRHGSGCGHYHYKNSWHDWPSHHVHTTHCGHHYWGGSYFSFGLGHVHGVGCGHFYDGGFWLSFGGYNHRHYAGCGHYYYSNFWHNYPVYHTHFDGCGHYYYNNYWHDFAHTHVHGHDCGHFYDGVRWYVNGYSSHTHYDGCGHHYWGNRWNTYPRVYYRSWRPQSFYFFVNLGDYETRSVPNYVQTVQTRYAPEPYYIDEATDPLSEGYDAFATKDYYNAVVHFNDAIKQTPDDGLLYFARAQANIGIDDYKSSYDDIIAGMELIPDWGRVKFNMIELYSDPEEFTKQLQKIEDWVEKYPRDFRSHFVLGYVYFFIQEYDLAKSELVYALAYEPEHAQAKRLIEDIYAAQAEADVTDPTVAQNNAAPAVTLP